MRKAVIVFAVGISLIIAGSAVTAFELTSWTPYNIEENVADFEKETIKTSVSFDELDTDRIIISNAYSMWFDYEDYLEGDSDYIDFDGYYMYSGDAFGRVNIVEDTKQEAGVIEIEYTYLTAFENETCGLDSVTHNVDNNQTEYRSHVPGRGNILNERSSRRDSRNRSRHQDRYQENTTYIFPQCRGNRNWGFGYTNDGTFYNQTFTKELKTILKHKQIPINMNQITVRINPSDLDRVQYR